MKASWSPFNIVSVVVGFAFLYLPIVLLVIYSFNESRLVTVWGGFSTKWYGELLRDQAVLDAAWVTLRVALISASVATFSARWRRPRSCALPTSAAGSCFPAWSTRRWSCRT